MTKENSLRIDFLKFVCAILVVAIHTPWPGGEIWSWTWIASNLFFGRGLSRAAVPFFFVCSGYFLARHLGTRQDWWQAVCKRVRTLIVPFFVWTWITALCLVVISGLTDLASGQPLGTTPLAYVPDVGWRRILKLLGVSWEAPLLIQLWYVRNLFLLVLTAPILSFLVKKLGCVWLIVCYLATIFQWMIPELIVIDPYIYSWSGVFYFSCGIYIFERGIKAPSFRQPRWLSVTAIILSCALLVGTLILTANGCITSRFMLEACVIPFILIGAWLVAPPCHLSRWLVNMSFQIYILHKIIISFARLLLDRIPFLCELPRTCAIMCLVVGIFGSILVAHALRRYCPRFARVAFGER